MFQRCNNQREREYPRFHKAFGVRVLFMLALIVVIGGMWLSGAVYAGTVNLPRTGQTTSYTADDDGALQVGVAWPSPRFKDNGDKTITDNLTGLQWTKDAGTPTSGSCAGGTKNLQSALDYVACLNGANYLGHNDWRLPNINELESLTNAGQDKLSIWLNTQGFVSVNASFYWSSTTLAQDTAKAWDINMFDGPKGAHPKTDAYYVWPVRTDHTGVAAVWATGQLISYFAGDDGAVRAGVKLPEPRFTANDDTTVTDNLTGLIWGRDAGVPTVDSCKYNGWCSWQGALDYIKCLNAANYLGYNNWRMPNRKESLSLVDHGRYNIAISTGHPFTNVSNDYSYWSSTTYANANGNAWYIHYGSGGTDDYGKGNCYLRVWPVRTGIVDVCTSGTINPTNKSFTASGGNDSVNVTAKSDCTWKAISNNSWLKITSGSSATGNGTVGYTVDPNNGLTRTGTMTIAGQTFTVTQDGDSGTCSYTITPTSKNFPSSGGDGSVSVTANTGCTWVPVSNATWITITSGGSGSGNGTVGYKVDPNTSTSSRTGTMTIAGKTFTVTQDAVPPPDCNSTSLTPTSKDFPSSGGNGSISVTANTGCTWTVSGDAGWITITSDASGSGNGTVDYTVAANTATSSRTGTMTIAGKTFTVTQAGTDPGQQVKLTVTKQGAGDGTVTAAPGTLSCVEKTCTASYDKDESVTLTASPALGSTIKAWTGCDLTIGANQCMVKMTTNKTVTVEFDGCSGSCRRVRHDFNGDGHADVLWRNTTTGDVAIWLMDGTKISGGDFVVKGVSADWDVKAIGDFNGDGKADVLWQNAAGDVFIWLIEGTVIKAGGYAVRGMPGEWEATALGDFNGDGKDDIMWRNTNNGDVYVWLMDGTNVKSGGGYVVKGMKAEWVVKAIADFNDDDKSDVLWRNTTTGDVAVWLMDGLSMSTGNYVATAVPDNWQIKAIDDFDGDSKADVLWQNSTTGDVVIWFMDGLSIAKGGFVQKGVPHNWQIKVVGDYDGDGKADILWQDTTKGDIYMYIMDGVSISGGGFVSFGLSSDWQPK